jgi:ribosomal protein S18 acetylase RimI-like enzyme
MPLLMLSRRTLDTGGQPTEFVRSLYRGDRYRFQTGLQRPRPWDATPISASNELVVRIARPDDADQLATVFIDAWRDAYRGVVDDTVIDALHHPDVASWLRNLVANTAARTFLAEKNDEVLGFTRFGDDANEPVHGHVFALYVSPSASRQGVGRRLLERAIDELDPMSTRAITLWVFEANTRARGFYEAAGFEPDGGARVEELYRAQEISMTRRPRRPGRRFTPENGLDSPFAPSTS